MSWLSFLPPVWQAPSTMGLFSPQFGFGAQPKMPVEGRFLLWVDGVGGYMVALGDRVLIGQPIAEDVDVPLLGDLSRRQCAIRRDADGYLIEPARHTRLDGASIDSPTFLRDGGILELGPRERQNGVRLRFRRPNPLSRSARLEFASVHRTQPATDGVLLMAETLLLGPAASQHVVCPEWPHDVVLFRRGGGDLCPVEDSFGDRWPPAFGRRSPRQIEHGQGGRFFVRRRNVLDQIAWEGPP